METLGHPTFVIALRMKNIVAFALGKMDAWGLTNYALHWDDWDYVHITTWNFLPFLLGRVGVAPPWVVRMTLAVWCAALAALVAVLWRLYRLLAQPEYTEPPSQPGSSPLRAALTPRWRWQSCWTPSSQSGSLTPRVPGRPRR